ncbi:MAG: MgtC/SapB family protein [Aggregatilineales bacterium]
MDLQMQIDLSLRLLVAAVLVALLGHNRQHYDHPAGLRTHILIGIGSSLFTALSLFAFGASNLGVVAAQIVSGIGFLGAGSIIRGAGETERVRGITTAAGIWTTAAIGMACGAGLYFLATFGTVLTWFVLEVVRRIEKKPPVAPSASPEQPM